MAMELAPVTEVPAEHSASADHHKHPSHHEDVSDQGGCSHCPPGGGEHSKTCLTSSAAGCEIVPAFNFDGRQIKLKLKDLSQVAVMPAMPMEQATIPATALIPLSRVVPRKHTSEPSLNIRYCVFLI